MTSKGYRMGVPVLAPLPLLAPTLSDYDSLLWYINVDVWFTCNFDCKCDYPLYLQFDRKKTYSGQQRQAS